MSIEKLKVENNQELEQMITNEINKVEKDLTVICSNVPITDQATLDILCHYSDGQLGIVRLSVNEDDIMLLHGTQSLDYIVKFKSFLKATYSKHKINDAEKPRLILIAPSFSDALRHAVESMKGIRIDLYEWKYLKLGDHKGLRLQPIFTWASTEKPKEKEEKLVRKNTNQSICGTNSANIRDASTSARARGMQSSKFNGKIDKNIKSGLVKFF